MNPTRKRLVFAWLTVALALIAAAAVAEVALRARYGRVEAITGVTQWQSGVYEDITYYWDQYHPRRGWTNRPGYRSDERVPFRVTINAQGLRADRDYTPAPESGTTRIAVLGDSSVFGEEVDDAHTLPVYLESKLPGTEVLNFGVHGYGAGQMLMQLEDEVLDYEPDLVVVVYLTFDVFRDPLPEFVHPKPVFGVEQGRLEIRNVPVPELSRQPWPIRHSFTAAWLWGRPEVTPDRAAGEDHGLLLSTILRRMQEVAADHDLLVVLVHILDRNTLEAASRDPDIRASVEAIRRVVRDSGGDVLDLTPLLGEAYRLDRFGLTKPHGHWSERGNELIAERIALHLRECGF